MVNKRIIRRKNRPLNIFANGGPVGSLTAGLGTDVSKITKLGQGGASGTLGMQPTTSAAGSNLGSSLGNISAIGSSVGTILNAGVSNAKIADTSGIEAGIKSQKNMVVGASSNDDLMNEWGSWNRSKDNYSWKDIRGGSTGQRVMNTLGATTSGAATGATVGGPVGAVIGGAVGLGSSVAGWFSGNGKAKRKARQLNKQAKEANERALSSFSLRADNLDKQSDLGLMANYSAYGGFIPTVGSSAIDYELSNKSLNNKQLDVMSKFRLPSMPNSFEVPEFGVDFVNNAGHLNAKGGSLGFNYKEDNIPLGTLYQGAYNSTTTNPKSFTNGGVFSNGITTVDNGGTHEENPLTGVPMGIAPDGQPNLVEEGEVIFNDYVFSNRLYPDEKMLKQVNLPTRFKDNTFASIAEKFNKEPKERPYDPISKRGLLSNMSRLTQLQEEIKSKEDNKLEGRQFKKGGDMSDYTLLDNTPYTWDDYMKDQKELSTESLSKRKPSSDNTDDNTGMGLENLRYAPALGAGVSTMSDLLGWTNKPDYSNADMVVDAVSGLPTIEAQPLGNYLSYNPFDKDYYINKLNQEASATRRGLMNTSGGNRLNAQAGILAADYNYGQNLGDLARKAEEYNLEQKERVETFNRGTNQFNSESALRAAGLNQQNKEMQLRAITQAAGMREDISSRSAAAKSANLSNFFDSLGDIGREEFTRNMIKSNPAYNYTVDRSGRVKYKNNTKSETKNKKKSKGGYLTYGK